MKEFLDHKRPVAGGFDSLIRFGSRRRDRDAFPGGKSVCLDDDRQAKSTERVNASLARSTRT